MFNPLGLCWEEKRSPIVDEYESWAYVGDGRGSYKQVQTFEFVGEGAGSFQQGTMLKSCGMQPRIYITIVGFFLVFAGVLYWLFGQGLGLRTHEDGWFNSHRRTLNAAVGAGSPPGAISIAPRYNCLVETSAHRLSAPSGQAVVCAAGLVEAAWTLVRRGNDRINRTDLDYCEERRLLDASAVQVLRHGDLDADGMLDFHEFVAALIKAGLAVSKVSGEFVTITSTALVEATWLAVNKNGGSSIALSDLGVITKQGELPARTLQVFLSADDNHDSLLSHGEFEAGLVRCGLSAFAVPYGSRAVVDTAVAEVAWRLVNGDGDAAVGKSRAFRSAQKARLPLEAVRAMQQAFARDTVLLSHADFLAALSKARLSTGFIEVVLAERSFTGRPLAGGSLRPVDAGIGGEGDAQPSAPITLWSSAKRLWCCEHAGVACAAARERAAGGRVAHKEDDDEAAPEKQGAGIKPSTSVAPVALPYDCQAGLVHWRTGWTVSKKVWCCKRLSLGCEDSQTSYDCEVGRQNWLQQWSPAKKNWCCLHTETGEGCLLATTLPYDCVTGFDDWERRWTFGRKRWCCKHLGRGCPRQVAVQVVTSQPYDCSVGFSNWMTGWSDSKKAWCCKHFDRACPPASNWPAYDCRLDPNWQSQWSLARRLWCCAHRRAGCALPEPKFDCDLDYTGCGSCLQPRWSAEKLAWCCAQRGRGCVATVTPSYDCTQGWRQSWSPAKTAWCCPEGACANATASAYDCALGYAAWESDWLPLKKQWCCQHHRRGCPGHRALAPLPNATAPAPTGLLPFDCDAGFTNCSSCLLKAWSKGKQTWCCSRTGRGCHLSAPSPPFDCLSEFGDWARSWPPEKKAWCCQRWQRGCPLKFKSAPFDCAVGYSNWRAGWSSEKQSWCCIQEGRGCNTTLAPSTPSPD